MNTQSIITITAQVEVSREIAQDSVPFALGAKVIAIESVITDAAGKPLCNGPRRDARVISARTGAHWADSIHGRAGYHVIWTVEVPDDGKQYVAV